MLEREINQEKQTNKQTTTTAAIATTKIKTSKKIRKTATTKMIPSQFNPFFRRIFHKQFTCFYLKNLFSKHYQSTFSILFTFRISAMRLFKFMNFFTLDLNTYNLNINRVCLINILFLKMELFADSRIPKWQPVMLKLVILNYFESIRLSPPINI